MPTTRYGNKYTLTLQGFDGGYAAIKDSIQAEAASVIEYASRYLNWSTSMDFVIKIGQRESGGLFPSYTGDLWLTDQRYFISSALQEAKTGVEQKNSLGEVFNAGLFIWPDLDGSLKNYGQTVWLDPTHSYPFRLPPSGGENHDFASIFLHEIAHSFGIRSGRGDTLYDKYIRQDSDGRVYFSGPETTAMNGGKPVELMASQKDHIVNVDGGLMAEPHLYRGNTWTFDRTTLAMLKDLGWDSRNVDELPLHENLTGITPAEMTGSHDGATEVYRFYNNATGTHFYTANLKERDAIKATSNQFVFEGNAFDSDASEASGLAVFRFFNKATGAHFYTASAAEKSAIQATMPTFNYEGVAYHAYAEVAAGREPLYRFFNSQTGTHFYTANETEMQNVKFSLPQMHYEGIAYYVDIA